MAGNQWATRKISSNLQTMPEMLKSKKQTSSKHVTRTRGSDTPMDKGCDWYLSLWEWLLSTYSWLYQQISRSA